MQEIIKEPYYGNYGILTIYFPDVPRHDSRDVGTNRVIKKQLKSLVLNRT